LDFSADEPVINRFEDILLSTIREIELEGIFVDLGDAKRTSGGYLAELRYLLWEEDLEIQIQISKRKGIKAGEVKTIAGDFILPYILTALSESALIAEKIQAFLTRHKARDFYDLYFVLRAGLLPASKRNILKKCLVILEKSDLSFNAELKVFLPRSHWAIIKDFRQVLSREIKRYV